MSLCKNPNCGKPNPPSAGYKQRETCSDKCRTAYSRSKSRRRAMWHTNAYSRYAAANIAPGDPGLVGRVERLIASMFDIERDEVAAAQAALALELATLAAAGSVSACRELRLLLLEMRWRPTQVTKAR